jgi:NADH-quinone oxidoreductase subunit G
MSVTIIIDGRKYEVPEGRRLIDACIDVGIPIPHFCYHPGLGPDGNCRMCQVEIVTPRGPVLAISCKTIVTEGMEVITDSERVKKVRAAVEEFLLLHHPLDCPICDKAGECTLQNYYMAHDLRDSRMDFPKDKRGKAMILGPTLVLDQERCVLCNRCVRFLRQVAGREELFIAGRGHNSYLTTFPGHEVTSPYSLNTVDLCPVGALTGRDFRFSSPTWFLTRSPSICTTCARGCNLFIDHRQGRIHRLRPRYNGDVNGYWMCDEGRLNYKFVNDGRLGEYTAADGRAADFSIETMKNRIRRAMEGESGSPRPAVILASLTCTLEELFLLKKLAAAWNQVTLLAVRHMPDGAEDNILRRADRHPNGRAAELLGLEVIDLREGGPGASPFEPVLADAGLLFAVGFNAGVPPALVEMFGRAETSILLAACESALSDRASFVLPGLTFAEKEGLLINFEGHLQRLFPALARKNESTEDWKILKDLLLSAGTAEDYKDISGVRRAIQREEASFAGLELCDIGLEGLKLQPQPAA